MADRKFKVAPGDEIIIKIPRGRELIETGGNPAKRKGMIRARRADDYLPRRLRKGGINFYDLRYYSVGSGYAELTAVNQQDTLTISDYVEYMDDVFSIGLDKFKNTSELIAEFGDDFRNFGIFPYIEPRSLFEFYRGSIATQAGIIARSPSMSSIKADFSEFNYRTLVDSLLPENDPQYSPKWTAAGLPLTDEDINRDIFALSGQIVKSSSPDYPAKKVTRTLDYNAEAVNFVPAKNIQVYIIPRLNLTGGEIQGLLGQTHPANYVSAPPYKSTFFASIAYDRAHPYFRKAQFHTFGADSPGDQAYIETYQSCVLLTSYGMARMNLIGTMPPPPRLPGNGEPTFFVDRFSTINYIGAQSPSMTENVPQKPVLLIKQGADIFYVWDTP